MKRIRIAYLFLVLVILGVGAAAWYVVQRGFSARTSPNLVESFLAPRLRAMAIPASARQAVNPVTASPAVLAEAMAHYADHCSVCHGNDGNGRTHLGAGMYPRPPDMSQPQTQLMTDGELYYIIHNGVRFTGMPAFGEDTAAPDEDSWKLVVFIRHLPNITAEELNQMDNMNPKSPMQLEEESQIQRFLQGDDSAPAEVPKHHH